jgi:dienelactone hydrolase
MDQPERACFALGKIDRRIERSLIKAGLREIEWHHDSTVHRYDSHAFIAAASSNPVSAASARSIPRSFFLPDKN